MFLPSRESGLRARRGVYGRLAESLAHIFQAAGELPIDSRRADLLLGRLAGGERFAPSLVGRYFDVLAAIETEDAAAIAAALDRLLAEEPHRATAAHPGAPHLAAPRLIAFAGPGMSPADADLIRRNIVLEELGGAAFGPLPEDKAGPALARFAAALALLAEAAPATYAEISETLAEVIVAQGTTGSAGYAFDGVSSLQYWGAILLNAAIPKTLLATCEAIAHEAGHNALFGFSPRRFFVENPESERYTSPLRDDPRPLDGIYHAAFVLARMHFAVSGLLASGRLGATEREEAEGLLARSARAYRDAERVLEANARFTAEGRAILSAASAYMGAAA